MLVKSLDTIIGIIGSWTLLKKYNCLQTIWKLNLLQLELQLETVSSITFHAYIFFLEMKVQIFLPKSLYVPYIYIYTYIWIKHFVSQIQDFSKEPADLVQQPVPEPAFLNV